MVVGSLQASGALSGVVNVPATAPAASQAGLSASRLADLAVLALVEEAELTPKPALVDRRGRGAHDDMDLPMLRRSAHALRPTFEALAERARGRAPDRWLREELARIGRRGEEAMFAATGGVNTHRGAVWALGLLVAATMMSAPDVDPASVASLAGRIAGFPDRHAPPEASHGARAAERYGVVGARGEAGRGFPSVVAVALPVLLATRKAGANETEARLDALVALISRVDDTCLLHRGGRAALSEARAGARAVLVAGGTGTAGGRRALRALEGVLLGHRASPGGSADLLAATLFLDGLRPGARDHDKDLEEEVA